jgi:hypothetical protein
MDFDVTKWFDVLKANAWQYACLSTACIALLLFDSWGWLPIQLDATLKQIIVVAAFVFAALWVASIGTSISKAARAPSDAFKRWRARRAHAKEFRAYIPHMTPESRAVIAQLLHENRKDFTADDDAGYASILLGRRYIVPCAVPGQILDLTRVPFRVPDHIWRVAVQHKADFPYVPDPRGGDAWRIPWMVR